MSIRLLIPVPAVLLLAACGAEAPRRNPAAATAPLPVETVTVAQAPWTTEYEATGTVRARTSANIAAKVMGYVREVSVRVGDRVKAGQTLVTVDARDLDADYRRAEAAVEEARAAMPEVQNAVAGAKAQLDLANATFGRMQDLFQQKSISNQEFDEATARLKSAQAAHAMALAKASQLKAKISQAERGGEAARIMLDYSRITAPFAGIVTARMADPGAMAAPGAPLLTLEGLGDYRLEAAVEESRIHSIKSGGAAIVTMEALDHAIPARVSEIVPAVDPGSRAYTVKIDLPASPALRSGMFGRAVFPQGSHQVVAVPVTAVTERGQLVSVMVAENGVAHTRLITVGERRGGDLEVLSGLNPGEKVIRSVPASLSDGARVEVRQ